MTLPGADPRSLDAVAVVERPVPDVERADAPSTPTDPPARRLPRITVEAALYAVILALAVLTRFWDLGSRTLHHDESLHAYYSWLYATGQGYAHDPLMHGPFLFHANALVYFLLGDSDASSRYMPALFGVVLVGLPYLLRGPRHLGRWGALIASALFLISPALLYQSRYIRHDIFTVVGSLVLFIGIVRYLERPERRWLVTVGASLGFLLTNHEIVFGLAAIFAGVLWGALLWGRLRPLVPLHLAVLVVAAGIWVLKPGPLGRPLPDIPWEGTPTRDQQLEFYREVLTHPLILALVLLLLLAVAAGVSILARRRDPERLREGWIESLLAGAPTGSVEAAVRNAWADRAGLSLMLAVAVAIFAVLFTSLFTNVSGLATGTIATDGTLLYWLGQHHYRRGEQPWFYYLLLMPQYEFIAVLFGGAATLRVAWSTRRVALGRAQPGPRFFFRLFLVVWFVAIFAALSWAGEKMPWLIVHITLPATLLAASLLGELVERWRPRTGVGAVPAAANGRIGSDAIHGWRWFEPALTVGLLVVGGCWFFLAARLTYGTFVESADPGGWERAVTTGAADRWWLLALPPLAAMLMLGVGWLLRGSRRTGRAALAALAIGLALLQVHAAWRTTYLEGDVPKDMLIYTQTSPDVDRMVDELGRLSAELTGGKGLEIWYDNNAGVSWPLQWYLRDFPNRRMFGASLAGPPAPDEAPVVIVGHDNRGGVEPFMDGYTAQEYVLRWWFPEDPIYRNFAIAPELNAGRSALKSESDPQGPLAILGSVVSSFATQLDPEGQQRVYRLLMYRDLPARIDSYRYTLYIRNDLVPLFNTIRY